MVVTMIHKESLEEMVIENVKDVSVYLDNDNVIVDDGGLKIFSSSWFIKEVKNCERARVCEPKSECMWIDNLSRLRRDNRNNLILYQRDGTLIMSSETKITIVTK